MRTIRSVCKGANRLIEQLSCETGRALRDQPLQSGPAHLHLVFQNRRCRLKNIDSFNWQLLHRFSFYLFLLVIMHSINLMVSNNLGRSCLMQRIAAVKRHYMCSIGDLILSQSIVFGAVVCHPAETLSVPDYFDLSKPIAFGVVVIHPTGLIIPNFQR